MSSFLPKLQINLKAIQDNYKRLKSELDDKAVCASVVKADAYGLGAEPVSKALQDAGCRHFFVAHPEEAEIVRGALGDGSEIYVLSGIPEGCGDFYLQKNITPVLNDCIICFI